MGKPNFQQLLRNSKFAQVPKPLQENILKTSRVPTHLVINTPPGDVARSEFGMKTTLPKPISAQYIAFNNIDNKISMPDVEFSPGPYFNKVKFQELGIPVHTTHQRESPLFPATKNKSQPTNTGGSMANWLNLSDDSSVKEVKIILKQNPAIYKDFKNWLLENHPVALLEQVPAITMNEYLRKFLQESQGVVRKKIGLTDFTKEKGGRPSIHGTGGLSYNQKGRITNTPNGLKYDTVAPGRLVGNKEASIAGFVVYVHDHTIGLQRNYAKNYPAKHTRQFVMPFKIEAAELNRDGSVKLTADGIRTGEWMHKKSSQPVLDGSETRSTSRIRGENDSLQSLLNLILPTS